MKNQDVTFNFDLEPVGTLLGWAAVGSGAYHGFMDAQGISLPKQNLEALLTFGPAVAHATVSGASGAVVGGYFGAISARDDYYHKPLMNKIHGTISAAVVEGGKLGRSMAAFAGATSAVKTAIGYGLGFAVGYVLR